MPEEMRDSVVAEPFQAQSVEQVPPPQVQPSLENGFVQLPGGDWLIASSQPAACMGNSSIKGLKGWIVPDRALLRRLFSSGSCWLSDQSRPFIGRLDAMPDKPLHVLSAKVLAAPYGARADAGTIRVIPLNFKGSLPYTDFTGAWVITATRSRVTRVSLEDGETLTVRPDALVAWFGNKPTGFCPRLSIWDMLLPRQPAGLSFSFHGPGVVWLEGSVLPTPRVKYFFHNS